MLPLLFRQVSGHLHVDRRVHVAALARLADDRHPLALQTKHLTLLCHFRNLEPEGSATDPRDGDLAAEDSRRDRDRDANVQVSTFALEGGMRLEVHAQLQIAGGRAAHARLALAGHADP